MKTFIFTLFILLMTGCAIIKTAKPLLNVYGESDYYYTRIGLIWGSAESYMTFLEEDDYMRGGNGSNNGSKDNGNSSSGCGGGSCHIR